MVQIRDTTPEDRDALLALMPDTNRIDVRLEQAGRGIEAMLIAEESGVVLGMASIRWEGGCVPPYPWLYGVEVAADSRGQGIGTALCLAAERVAIDHGAHAMTLDVDADNEAVRRLYHRLGYRTLRRHAHRWRSVEPGSGRILAEGVSDTFLMQKDLP